MTPADAALLDLGDDRDFTVATGDATSVRVALIECANVTIGPDGTVSFETNPNGTVNYGTTTGASITELQGVATGGTTNAPAVPVEGQVSFTVTSNNNDPVCVIPVVFVPNTAGQFVVDADGVPTGDFGIGGDSTFR